MAFHFGGIKRIGKEIFFINLRRDIRHYIIIHKSGKYSGIKQNPGPPIYEVGEFCNSSFHVARKGQATYETLRVRITEVVKTKNYRK
jgi:hypothetical protein